MIRIVDCHDKSRESDGLLGWMQRERVEYIGRAGMYSQPPPRSPLSNPYSFKQHGDAAIRLYRVYLVNALATSDRAIVTELARLEQLASTGDLGLGCWCVVRPPVIEGLGLAEPEARCHGDIVATVLEHWGVRLATFARPLHAGDSTGPERWAAFVAREFGMKAHACLAMVFGSAEFRELAKLSPEIAAGMPKWMQR